MASILEDFEKDENTGFWEADVEVNAEVCDVHIELSEDAKKQRKHIGLSFKGEDDDPNPAGIDGGLALGTMGITLKSEFAPYTLHIQCGDEPVYARLTER